MRAITVVAGVVAGMVIGYGTWAIQPEGADGPPAARKDGLELIGRDFRQPEQVLDDFHSAAAAADFNRYFSHWTPESVFLGTDATERWVGDEFKDFARPIFERGKGWTYKPRDRHVTVVGPDVVFFDELLDHGRLGTCRGSGVLKRFGAQAGLARGAGAGGVGGQVEQGDGGPGAAPPAGEWKVMQYNLSIPVPNDKAEAVVRVIRPDA
jgi:hypothetical protein